MRCYSIMMDVFYSKLLKLLNTMAVDTCVYKNEVITKNKSEIKEAFSHTCFGFVWIVLLKLIY